MFVFAAKAVLALFTLHDSSDNRMIGGQARLSCDGHWQPADEERNDRWLGLPLPGHGDQSYGGLTGAHPLIARYMKPQSAHAAICLWATDRSLLSQLVQLVHAALVPRVEYFCPPL